MITADFRKFLIPSDAHSCNSNEHGLVSCNILRTLRVETTNLLLIPRFCFRINSIMQRNRFHDEIYNMRKITTTLLNRLAVVDCDRKFNSRLTNVIRKKTKKKSIRTEDFTCFSDVKSNEAASKSEISYSSEKNRVKDGVKMKVVISKRRDM